MVGVMEIKTQAQQEMRTKLFAIMAIQGLLVMAVFLLFVIWHIRY